LKELAYQFQSLPRAASVPSPPLHCVGSSPSYKEGLTASQQQSQKHCLRNIVKE